jgi:hypothetical protein
MPEKNLAVFISSNYVIVFNIICGRQRVSNKAMRMADILSGYIKGYNCCNILKNTNVTFMTERC